MTDLFILTAYIAAEICLFKFLHKPKSRDITPELLNRLDKIYYLKQQYIQAQQLLFDIDMSKPDSLKNIELEWETATGKIKQANIWTDGKSHTTKQMRLAVVSRLEEISTSLNSELDKIPKRSSPNIDQTTAQTQRGER